MPQIFSALEIEIESDASGCVTIEPGFVFDIDANLDGELVEIEEVCILEGDEWAIFTWQEFATLHRTLAHELAVKLDEVTEDREIRDRLLEKLELEQADEFAEGL